MAGRLAPVRVAPAALVEAFDEASSRVGAGELGEVRIGDEAHPGAGGLGLSYRHRVSSEVREALEDRDALAGRPERWPSSSAACGRAAAALGLGPDADRADIDHVDVEESFDGLADLGVVGVGVDAEGVLVHGREDVALLGDDWPDDHLGVSISRLLGGGGSSGGPGERPERSSACSERTGGCPSRSATPTSASLSTATRARLRKDRAASASSAASATSVGRGAVPAFEQREGLARRGLLKALGSRIASEPRRACRERALRSAARCSLRLTLKVYERGLGPKTVPPPVHIGERLEPAAPVPSPSGARALPRRRRPFRGSWSRPCRACVRPARRGRFDGRALPKARPEGGLVELRPATGRAEDGSVRHRHGPPRARHAVPGPSHARAGGFPRNRRRRYSRPL